jgi:hypothetical protein
MDKDYHEVRFANGHVLAWRLLPANKFQFVLTPKLRRALCMRNDQVVWDCNAEQFAKTLRCIATA